MTDSIKDFTDEDLLEIYTINAHQLSIARRKPELYGSRMKEFIHDQTEIEKEIDGRQTIDYRWEIEAIKHGSNPLIRPGRWFKHKVIGSIRIQIVDEYDFTGPMWTARAFLVKAYLCRFIVKTSTILEHFQPIEP